MAISKYRLKQEVEAAYRQRGRHRPTPRDEDADLRRAWEREMERRQVEEAAEQAEDDEFWREQQ